MFHDALTEAGLCAICFSKEDGIVWCPSGPVSCSSCGYEYSNLFGQDSSISLDYSHVPSGLLVSSDRTSDDECREVATPAGECNALACGCHTCMSGSLRVTTEEGSYAVPASGCHTLASGSPASGRNAPASGSSNEAPEPHRHQRRSTFCGSRAMGGVDFDGSPISENDDEDYMHDHVLGNTIVYHEIWDHGDIPLEHEIVDQSELLPGYNFASGLFREELRSRYQFRGNGIVVDSVDSADAYVRFDLGAELRIERKILRFSGGADSKAPP